MYLLLFVSLENILLLSLLSLFYHGIVVHVVCLFVCLLACLFVVVDVIITTYLCCSNYNLFFAVVAYTCLF